MAVGKVSFILAILVLPLLLVGTLIVIVMAGDTEWLKNLRGWQSGLGALIGLSGITVAALFNANLARDRDDRLRSQDAVALATELLAEVSAIKQQLSGQGRLIKLSSLLPEHRSDLLRELPSIQMPVHDECIGRLGILGPKLVLQLETLFRMIRFAEGSLAAARQIIRIDDAMAKVKDARIGALDAALKQTTNAEEIQKARNLTEEVNRADSENQQLDMYQTCIDAAVGGYALATELVDPLVVSLAQFTGVDRKHPFLKS